MFSRRPISLAEAATLAVIAVLGFVVYRWQAGPSPLPSGPRNLRPAPAELTLKPGVPGFTMTREGQNWVIAADRGVMSNYVFEGSSRDTDLWQFMIRPPGSNGVMLADLRRGLLTAVPDGRNAVPSPDLQFLLIEDWLPRTTRAVQTLGLEPRSFLLPPGTNWARWDGATLFASGDGGPRAVVDPAAGKYWMLPSGQTNHMRRVGDQVCYQHARRPLEVTAVVCFTPGGSDAPVFVLDRTTAEPAARTEWLHPDPPGHRLALVYRRPLQAQVGGAGVALEAGRAAMFSATKPSPSPVDLANTLAIYDAESGQTSRVALPARLAGTAWSPGGKYLGLQFQAHPEIWVVESATGKVFVSGRDPLPWTPYSWTYPGEPSDQSLPIDRWRLREETQNPNAWRLILEPITPSAP